MNDRDVFINCPFTSDYEGMLRATVFAVVRCGFKPRCALEDEDGGEVRIEKICRIISDCRLGIHDISNTELDATTNLPRFNMPLELGLFLGARKFGAPKQRKKKALILDCIAHRYDQFISDISGQEVEFHNTNSRTLIFRVVKWLRPQTSDKIPGGTAIANLYERFERDLPDIAAEQELQPDEITFRDLAAITAEWIVAEASSR